MKFNMNIVIGQVSFHFFFLVFASYNETKCSFQIEATCEKSILADKKDSIMTVNLKNNICPQSFINFNFVNNIFWNSYLFIFHLGTSREMYNVTSYVRPQIEPPSDRYFFITSKEIPGKTWIRPQFKICVRLHILR
jgi:hypothetical protein